MASIVPTLRNTARNFLNSRLSGQQNSVQVVISRSMNSGIYTESGAIRSKPPEMRFGVLKVLAVVLPFLYAGASMSKTGAAFLEENEIFVPDDDDDD